MKYFAVNFPNLTTFIVKTEKSFSVRDIVFCLGKSVGMVGTGDIIYNPTQFISVNSIGSPDERQKKVAKDLDKVLF